MKSKKISSKMLVLIVALAFALCGVVGGTIAWIVDQTDTVTNTFTYGDINIGLTETDTELDGDGDPTTNDYEMVPGNKLAKDPLITVNKGSEDCWLFVKLEKSANFDTFLTYTMVEGWNELPDVAGVYYREVAASDKDQTFGVLAGDVVTVKNNVTKEQFNALDADGAKNYPTLKVTAYAVQKANIATAAEAWGYVGIQ